MTDPSTSNPQEGATWEADATSVAATLAHIRAGVRQHQALLAIADETPAHLPACLAAMQANWHIARPRPVSHRRWLGPPLVFMKKVVYQVFMKWYCASVLEQQNTFNRTVALGVEEFFERQHVLARALAAHTSTGASPSREVAPDVRPRP